MPLKEIKLLQHVWQAESQVALVSNVLERLDDKRTNEKLFRMIKDQNTFLIKDKRPTKYLSLKRMCKSNRWENIKNG